MSSISSASSAGTAVHIRSYLYYRHTAGGAHHALDQRDRADGALHERSQHFQRPSGAVLGPFVVPGRPPVLEIGAMEDADNVTGMTRILGHDFDTTGLFGASRDASGEIVAATFPSWLTIPGNRWLSLARQWHFLFAWIFVVNGLCYVLYAIWSRHLGARSRADREPTGARSDARSSTTCASIIRPGRHRSVTTCCRS